MGNNITWQKYSNEIAEQDTRTRERLGGSEWQKWSDGQNLGRVMPSVVPGESPFKIVKEHRVSVPGAKTEVVFVCPEAGCETCARSEHLYRTGNPADRDEAYSISAKMRVYFNWIDRANEDAGPRKAAVSGNVYKQMEKIRNNPSVGGDFTDVQKGFDLIIEKVPPGARDNNTKFPQMFVSAARNNSPLGTKDQLDDWITKIHDLAKIVPLKSPDEIKRLLAGDAPARGGRVEARQIDAPRKHNKIQEDILEATPEDDADLSY